MKKKSELEFKYKVIGFIITLVLFTIAFTFIFAGEKDDNKKSKVPDEVELMSYAQMVLKDNLYNPKYSSYKGDYTFIGTGLRYKIEGKVNGENFWMIIQFIDNTYKEYDLISLQVGNQIIYKK